MRCARPRALVVRPVAAIAAVDGNAAFDALDLIDVSTSRFYRSARSGGPRARRYAIHDYGDAGNIHKLVAMEFGDTEGGVAGRIESTRTSTSTGEHALPLEQPRRGRGPLARRQLRCGPPPRRRTRAPGAGEGAGDAARRIGSSPAQRRGVGGKSDPFNHEIVVALSRGQDAVKICLTREEVFSAPRTPSDHDEGPHGVKRDGRSAMHFQTLLDGGGYGFYGVASTYYTGALQP